MSTFFKKVASAFVVFEEDGVTRKPENDAGKGLDDIAQDASALLAQLDAGSNRGDSGDRGASRHAAPSSSSWPPPRKEWSPPASSRPSGSSSSRAPESGSSPQAAPVDPTGSGASIMQMTADDVFAAANLADGPHSARRVLKMIAGLAMFPPQQQLLMIRAMDAADETWNEQGVLVDAKQRQTVLRNHVEKVAAERTAQLQQLDARIQDAQEKGQAFVQDIDRQIAELQKLRQEGVQETAAAVAGLEAQKREVDAAAERAHHGIQQVIHGLATLINFFTGAPATGTSAGSNPRSS